MATVIYADVLFLVNFSMDFISLSSAASLLARQKKPLRMSIASALGALYGVISVIIEQNTAVRIISAFTTAAIMCIISFGYGSFMKTIQNTALMMGCGALIGGIMTSVISLGRGVPTISLAVSSCIVLFFIIRIIRIRKNCEFAVITVRVKNKKCTFTALHDSGNLICDTFSGAPVILTSRYALAPLFDEKTLDMMVSFSPDIPCKIKIRPVPIKTGTASSLTAAFRADEVIIKNGKNTMRADCYIAVSPKAADYFGGHSATVPSSLIP